MSKILSRTSNKYVKFRGYNIYSFFSFPRLKYAIQCIWKTRQGQKKFSSHEQNNSSKDFTEKEIGDWYPEI